jgi:hypothetical protein
MTLCSVACDDPYTMADETPGSDDIPDLVHEDDEPDQPPADLDPRQVGEGPEWVDPFPEEDVPPPDNLL